MTSKLMTSAFALTAVMALGAIPVAASAHDPEPVHHSSIADSYNDNSTDVDVDTDVKTDVDVDKSFNTDSSTDNSVDVDDSYNTDNSTDNSVDVDDSFNSKVEDSNNDNREYKTDVDIDDSFNSKVDDSYNTKVDDSFNSDSSTNDNSDHSTHNTDIRVALSLQDLEGNVSGFSFSLGSDHHPGALTTGDINNSGFAGFAGINTANNNTGFAANNQAATAISANANVTFGNGGTH